MDARAEDGGLNLIFDADDTLWESNVHFLEAEAEFIAELEREAARHRREIEAALRRHELEIIETHGYGRGAYVVALHRVAHELTPDERRHRMRARTEEIGARLIDRYCAPLPAVPETLEELARRHRLILFTKGNPGEQLRKLERSGLRHHFSRVGVPREKDPAAYRLLVAQAELDPERTFMIGNSPRSDINPALRAGLGAVFIPYPHTWELEHEPLDETHERFIALNGFHELRRVF
jgi:putative hydrolase of the HAD superfamily